MTDRKKHKKKQAVKIWLIAGASALAIFAVLASVILGVYEFNWSNRFFVSATKNIPFPALYIRGAGFVSVNEVKSDLQSVKKFYESQDFAKLGMRIDFNTDQGQKRLKVKEKEIISKLVENKVVEALAEKQGIAISNSDVNAELEKNIAQFGNKDNLMSDLARLYGWTIDDFSEKVVKPEMYAAKLSENYAGSLDTGAEQEKAQDLYKQATAKNADFATIAKENSDGQSGEDGGDLGWSTQDQLIGPVGEKAFSMKVGEISDPVESELGFHILKLTEKKTDNGVEIVHLSQIFVKKPTFSDWLSGQMKNYPVTVFVKEYQWNSGDAKIGFRDSEMQKFEKNLPANSEGDPSVF
ncbi:MAG: peptidylprolyl isomerase [Candidatus Moranbacteria bacterium]|nr:peptidylprolyl isomerase [Candidatus Moranbacteria bacterium]